MSEFTNKGAMPEFGVPSTHDLAVKAKYMITDDLETYNFATESEQLQWLYEHYREQIYPDYYQAWRYTNLRLLEHASLGSIADGSVSVWFDGFAPVKGVEQWQPALLRVSSEIDYLNDDPCIQLAREGLHPFKVALEHPELELIADVDDAKQAQVIATPMRALVCV